MLKNFLAVGLAGASGAELFVRGMETPVPVDLDDFHDLGSAEPCSIGSETSDCRAFGNFCRIPGLKDSESPSLPSSCVLILRQILLLLFILLVFSSDVLSNAQATRPASGCHHEKAKSVYQARPPC